MTNRPDLHRSTSFLTLKTVVLKTTRTTRTFPDRHHFVDLLFAMLPTSGHVITNIMGCSEEVLDTYSVQEDLSLFRNNVDKNSWNPDRPREAKSAIVDLFDFLDSKDRDHHGRAVTPDVSLHHIVFRDVSVTDLRTRREVRLPKEKRRDKTLRWQDFRTKQI
jgi:hypothetical protein